MSVKKAYTNLISFLEVNADKKIKSVLEEIKDMCSAKSAGSSATTAYRNEDGVVTFIRCGYFGLWMPVSHVEFSPKAGSASGYSPMSKEGTNLWSKQQRDEKKAKEDLLNQMVAGDIKHEDLGALMEQIEIDRLARPTHPFGFETIEEALAADLNAIVAADTPASESLFA